MWGRVGLTGGCGSRMGGAVVPERLVVNVRVPDGTRAAVGRGGPSVGFPACNAAPPTAELQPTVVAASRRSAEARCLLKGKVSVFSCDKKSDVGLLVGTLEC
jgi:hypothetical protein